MKVAYFHGLETPPQTPKNDLLRNTFDSVYDPPMDYYEDKDLFEKILSDIKLKKPDLLIGSSMGGWFAYCLSTQTGIPTLLFNPAVHSRSTEPKVRLGDKSSNHTIVFGKNDIVIDPNKTKKWFSAQSGKFNYNYESNGHRTPINIFEKWINERKSVLEFSKIKTKLPLLNEFLEDRVDFTELTYEQYCLIVDASFSVDEGFMDKLKDIKDSISKKILNAFGELKTVLVEISDNFGVGFDKILQAFKNKDMFALLKGIGFNFKILLKSITEISGLMTKGLTEIFREITETNLFQKIKDGIVSFDELLDKYPLLKKVGGIAVAGLLLYIWLNMSFTGDFTSDFDMSNIIDALRGKFSLSDLFASPSGLLMLSLLGTGGIMSAAWLGNTIKNLILGLFYTGYMKLKDSDHKIALAIKSKIPTI